MSELRSPLGAVNRPNDFAFDVIGVGALNLDYIASAPTLVGQSSARSMTERVSELVERIGPPLEWGTERLVDSQTVYAAIEAVSSVRSETVLGGSAYNAIHSIAQTRVGLRLGYVGVAGRVPLPGVSFVQQFEALRVDHRFVFEDYDHMCGICFSFSEGGDRTLLTHAGANEYLTGHLSREFARVVEYLARARVVHVTSFLDDVTAGCLLSVLEAVKKVNHRTLICFDPGHVWSAAGMTEVDGLIRISDYLLVNSREFRELGGQGVDDSDEGVAARLLQRFSSEHGVIVVKRPDGISSYRQDGGKVFSEFYAQVPLADDEIEDATGAGDVFAAGLLAVLTCDRLQIEMGSLLGMRLAKHKLRYVGSTGHAQFAQVTREFIRSLDRERRARVLPRGVFIAHGARPDWLAVQRFIEERFGLPVYSFESGPWSGRAVAEALAEYLDRCSLAICVLTVEDFTGDGQRMGRQNVIHEVGLFQGRHGFDRVIVLVEEGCDFVPQAARPYLVQFPRNRIGNVFYQLDEMIRSRHLGAVEEE